MTLGAGAEPSSTLLGSISRAIGKERPMEKTGQADDADQHAVRVDFGKP